MVSKRPPCGCTHVQLASHGLPLWRRAVITHTMNGIDDLADKGKIVKPYWAKIKYAVSLKDPDERAYAYCFIRMQ